MGRSGTKFIGWNQKSALCNGLEEVRTKERLEVGGYRCVVVGDAPTR